MHTTVDQDAAFLQLFNIIPAFEARNIPAAPLLANGWVFIDQNGKVLREVPSNPSLVEDRSYLFNQTFYKSFEVPASAHSFELALHQAAHYFTVYNGLPTHIPAGELNTPGFNYFDSAEKIVVVQVLPLSQCLERLDSFLSSLTAPNPVQLQAINDLLPLTKLRPSEIKSFEIRIRKHFLDGTFPSEPKEALRALIYHATGSTLLIKNSEAIHEIKRSANPDTVKLFGKTDLAALSSIFLRYKPLFLAFKCYPGCGPIINKLRRLAEKHHAPLPFDCFQNLLQISQADRRKALIEKASNRDLIKALNSLFSYFQTKKIYRVRNGKVFVKTKETAAEVNPYTSWYYDLVGELKDQLAKNLSPSLKGKTFVIPPHITYAAPTSEKQMIGKYPYGTALKVPENYAFTIGIHWNNYPAPEDRLDLDLHLKSAEDSYGWNSAGRDRDLSIIYSGDLVDAPPPSGAAEAFYLKANPTNPHILSAFKYSGEKDVPFTLFIVAEEGTDPLKRRGYIYDPNKAFLPPIPLRFGSENEQIIGVLQETSFYLTGGRLSESIVPRGNYASLLEAETGSLKNRLSLEDLLQYCGATIIRSSASIKDTFLPPNTIPLYPEDITEDTLLEIIDGKML